MPSSVGFIALLALAASPLIGEIRRRRPGIDFRAIERWRRELDGPGWLPAGWRRGR